MCKVKGCPRPSFVGGLCGTHALQDWTAGKRGGRRAADAASTPVPAPRRRVVARPASG